MSELKKLGKMDYDIVNAYIYKRFWPCIEIAKVFNKNGLNNVLMDKNSGDFYGYFEEGVLQGLFLFTNNKRFLLHFINNNVSKKVDLLKAIRHYKPEYMSGVTENVSIIWKMFERTVKRYKYNESMYMVLNEFEKPDEGLINGFILREAVVNDAKTHVNFLIELERHFGRRHMTMNQLQQRIDERIGHQEYLVVCYDDKIVAQGFVEDKINAFSQIGGIYTSPKFRGQRLGEIIVNGLSKQILDIGHIPILAVLKNNLPAVKLYERLNFKQVADFSIIELEF